MIVGAKDRAPYWLVRRSIILFNELTAGVDISSYREALDANYDLDEVGRGDQLFRELYDTLEAHGFELIDFDEARAEALVLRRLYDAQLEYLIDGMLAPRGFWGHQVGHQVASMQGQVGTVPDLD
ncbi:MAG: hypothetical protein GY773_05475 [Actinomycetia bacterium]|nr:hypothetical protein [Actinomycetes bacterium]